MAQIKGSLLISRMKFLDEHATPEQRQRVFNLLQPECRRALSGAILPVTWYPIPYVYELMEAMEKVMAQGSDCFIEDIGRFSARQASRGIYNLFFCLGNPEFILRRCPSFWSQLMNTGRIEVVVTGQRRATLSLRRFDQQLPRIFLRSLAGWTQGLLEVSGAKNVRVEILQWPAPDNFDTVFSAAWDR